MLFITDPVHIAIIAAGSFDINIIIVQLQALNNNKLSAMESKLLDVNKCIIRQRGFMCYYLDIMSINLFDMDFDERLLLTI